MAETLTLEKAFAELHKVAPEAPFLALGQTVFWDEPMKGGIALASKRLGYERQLYAGVHDTDYFAKLPSGARQSGKFKALPHNDTSTRGLWSAAAEFSTLFGSEKVVSREILQSAGLRIGTIAKERPRLLDEATEAWGWRGIVSLDEQPPISAEVPLKGLFRELYDTLDWALQTTLDTLTGADKTAAETLAEELRAAVCSATDEPDVKTLGDLYTHLVKRVYAFCANRDVDLIATRTTELLRFNTQTCAQPRFKILDIFLRHSREANAAYDQAISGSEMYGVARFGTGAIPFDLVVPGEGRGTIRIGNRGIVVNTPRPLFISLKKPVRSVEDLAAAVEAKLGSSCTLVGKAVTLIGMLAAEFVFVFHEGASPYVKYSRRLHDALAPISEGLRFNPIFRVKYSPWDTMQTCCAWLHLPECFRAAFGADEICAPSFAGRWRQVAQEQEALLEQLAELRRPIDLIRFLDRKAGGSWNTLAEEYEQLHATLEGLKDGVEAVRCQRVELYDEERRLRRARLDAEKSMGDHFREKIFEKSPQPADIEERERLRKQLHQTIEALNQTKRRIKSLMREQQELVRDAEVLRAHDRRRSIELEAELKRLSLIRTAVISGRGLVRANNRPSAWWFPLVCPDGLWFRATVENAECYLEPLQA
jgi:hypothetical protein